MRSGIRSQYGDRPVHQWCDQKTSVGRWTLQLHSVLTAVGLWHRLVCRLTYCCRNQGMSEPARLPASEECPSVLVDGSVVVDVRRRSTAILFVVRGSASSGLRLCRCLDCPVKVSIMKHTWWKRTQRKTKQPRSKCHEVASAQEVVRDLVCGVCLWVYMKAIVELSLAEIV